MKVGSKLRHLGRNGERLVRLGERIANVIFDIVFPQPAPHVPAPVLAGGGAPGGGAPHAGAAQGGGAGNRPTYLVGGAILAGTALVTAFFAYFRSQDQVAA